MWGLCGGGGGVVIGEDAVLHPHVVIYAGARLGASFMRMPTRSCGSNVG